METKKEIITYLSALKSRYYMADTGFDKNTPDKIVMKNVVRMDLIDEILEKVTKEDISLTKYPTCDLVKELETREGVKTHTITPYTPYAIQVATEQLTKFKDFRIDKEKEWVTTFKIETGPAIILEVIY